MEFTPELLGQVLTAVATGSGVYAGIRADIKALRDKADRAQKTADTAHKRIDTILYRREK
jgi:outer membrane murein-binding lipoprotein Lpp